MLSLCRAPGEAGYDETSWQTGNDSADTSCGERPRSRRYLPAVLHITSPLSARGESQAPAPPPQTLTPAPAAPPIAGPALQSSVSPRTANYDIDVTLDPATRTLTGSELITWHNQGVDRGLFDPAASVLERLPQHQLDVAEAAPPGRRRSVCPRRRGRLRLHRRHEDHHRQRRRQRRPRPDEGPSLHLA